MNQNAHGAYNNDVGMPSSMPNKDKSSRIGYDFVSFVIFHILIDFYSSILINSFHAFYREIASKELPQTKDNRGNVQPYNAFTTVTEGEPNAFQVMRHSQIIQQCSSSTDEGCDTDHGEMEDVIQPSVPPSIQRLNSYASSSSSSGVVTNFPSKSLSQNLSCESSRSNFSTFESLDLNLSDCSDLAASLPSCATTMANAMIDNAKDHGNSLFTIFPKCFHEIQFVALFVCSFM